MVVGGGKNTVVPASAPVSLSQDGGHLSATSLSLALAQKPGQQSTTATGGGSVTSVIFR